MGSFCYTHPNAKCCIATCPTYTGIKDYSSSMHKPPCNFQPKHIHNSILTLSLNAKHYFPPPNTITMSFTLLLLTVSLPLSLLHPPLSRSLLNIQQKEKGVVRIFFCIQHPRALLRIVSYLRLTQFSYRALSCTGTQPDWISRGQIPPMELQHIEQISVKHPHQPSSKHRGTAEQHNYLLCRESTVPPRALRLPALQM